MTQGGRTPGIAEQLDTRAGRDPKAKLDARQVTLDDFVSAYLAFDQAIRDVAAATDTPLIDISALIPPDVEHFYDLVHLSEARSMAQAELVADALADLIAR